MTDFFLKILNMSISASYLILAVLLLRPVLKKAPKWVAVALWGMVAVRLVSPFALPSPFSVIPSTETVSPGIMTDPTPSIQSGIPLLNNTLNPILGEAFAPAPGESVNPMQFWIPLVTAVWTTGIALLLVYAVTSYFRVKRKVGTAVLYKDNLFQSENVVSPFVLGLFKPKVYLPFGMEEKDMEYVVAHETAHIRRKDHLWKPLGFLLLTLHWFNPLMWLGYVLLCRDIESACDERVAKTLDREGRADYSQALLTYSVNRRMISACPLAFGETGVKSRVKSVLHYKKPAFWLVLAGILVCAAVTLFFLTDPMTGRLSMERTNDQTVEIRLRYFLPEGPNYSVRYVPEDEGEYTGDGMRIYDGNLGKYRILLDFGDMEAPASLREEFPTGTVVEREVDGVTVRVKKVHPQDHGFALYFGFDVPIAVASVQGKLNTFGGTLKIPVTLLAAPYGDLADQYPEYFGLDYSNGLDVYVWQMAAGSYSFGLQPHADPPESPISEKLLGMKSASLEEMRAILTSYPLTARRIHVIPWQNPASSYLPAWNLVPVGENMEKEKQLFADEIRRMLFDTYDYPVAGDEPESTYFDFDGDGNRELCSVHCGAATAMDMFTVTVKAGNESYCQILWTDNAESCTFSFYSEKRGELMLKVTSPEDPDLSRLLSITVRGGRLFIKENGTYVGVTPAPSQYVMDRPIAREVFDVDGDGILEVCSLYPGRTSGIFTFGFSAREVGEETYDFNVIFYADHHYLSFCKDNKGVWRVQGIRTFPKEETHLYDIGIADGIPTLTENGTSIGEHWNLS